MKLLANPVVLIVVGVLLGVGTTFGVINSAAAPLIHEIVAKRKPAKKAVRPEQPWDFWTTEIETLAAELKVEKNELRAREDAIGVREARLVAEREELLKTRQQLETLRGEISSKMVEVQVDEAKNLKTLANTYSNLSPKAAVAILKEMDESTVVKVLSLMKTEVVSALFEEMGKSSDTAVVKRAASLSEKMRLLKAAKSTATASTP